MNFLDDLSRLYLADMGDADDTGDGNMDSPTDTGGMTPPDQGGTPATGTDKPEDEGMEEEM